MTHFCRTQNLPLFALNLFLMLWNELSSLEFWYTLHLENGRDIALPTDKLLFVQKCQQVEKYIKVKNTIDAWLPSRSFNHLRVALQVIPPQVYRSLAVTVFYQIWFVQWCRGTKRFKNGSELKMNFPKQHSPKWAALSSLLFFPSFLLT